MQNTTFNEGVLAYKEHGLEFVEQQAMIWNLVLENSKELEEHAMKQVRPHEEFISEAITETDWDFNK